MYTYYYSFIHHNRDILKQLILSFFTFCFPLMIIGQSEFQIPRHADGRVFASEKFEMIEKILKLRNVSLSEKEQRQSTDRIRQRSGKGEMIVGDANVVEAELHAAVNPTDPNNIVVGVINIDASNLTDPIRISVYVTYDLGDSWTKSDFNGFEEGVTLGGGDPMFAFDDAGALYFSWLRFAAQDDLASGQIGLYATESLDGGLTWKDFPNPIAEHSFTDFVLLSDLETFVDKQWMASDHSDSSPYKGNVYIAYLNLDVEEELYDIVIKTKQKGQSEFDSVEVKVSHDNKILAQFVNVEVDNKGNIYVIYLSDDDPRLDRNGIYLAMSSDGGKVFTEPQRITEFHFPDFGSGRLPIEGINSQRLYPCPQLGLDRSGGEYEGRMYLTFTAYGISSLTTDGADIYIMYSDDQGLSWSDPLIVNDDLDPTKDQYYPSITVTDAGQPALAWYDRRNDLNNDTYTDYYLGYSDDGGESFEQFQVSGSPTDFTKTLDGTFDFGIGEYNEIVSSGSFIVPFWTDGRTNTGDLTVYGYFYDRDGTSVIDKKILLTDKIAVSSPLPNPAQNHFEFGVKVTEASPLDISLLDSSGRTVINVIEEKNYLGEDKFMIDTSDLNSGMYLLVITSKQGTQSRKVVVE